MRFPLVLYLVIILAGCSAAPPAGLYGAYRLDDGRIVSVRRSEGDTLRYRMYASGETGRLYPESDQEWISGEGFSGREPVSLRVRFEADGKLRWMPAAGGEQRGSRFLRTEAVEFPSDGTTLRGQLVMPAGDGPFPAVALVHGSGDQSAVEYFAAGDFLAAHGVATLIYDKRGSASSEGEFTFDFRQLARDAVAAVTFLAGHEKVNREAIGLCGYSQGAWVAPLAASMDSRIRFVSVAYGMIESPADEALWEIQDLLRSRGVSEAGIREATPLIKAAVAIVASDFENGWEAFEAQKKVTKGAAWRAQFGGSPVEKLLTFPRWVARIVGPRLAPDGLDWNYASDAVLDELDIPMTWLLASEDSSAPNRETIRKLRGYAAAGKPFELVVFEGADHTMLLFEEQGGQRVYTGYAPGYFEAEVTNVLRMSAAGRSEVTEQSGQSGAISVRTREGAGSELD